MREFRSKVDGWLVVLLVAGLILPLSFVVLPLVAAGGPKILVPLALLLPVAGFVVWILAATRYTIEGRTLTVRSGPFRWRIEIDAIESVQPSRNPLSSPALSIDRLEIRRGGRLAMLVSPADKAAFLRALAAASPGLEPREGGLVRRSEGETRRR
jgi:hypothetical protein